MSENDQLSGTPRQEEPKPAAVGSSKEVPDESSGNEEDEGHVEVENKSPLREQIEEAIREKDQFRTIAQRAQADLVNYRRRASEELDECRRTANANFLLQLLSFLDDLDRAIGVIPDDAVVTGWMEGLRLVRRSLDNLLDSEGVRKIEAEGRMFEPREFEAVQYQEVESDEEGMVIAVVRSGYKHNGRVLRAAQVVVAKRPEAKICDEDNKQEER